MVHYHHVDRLGAALEAQAGLILKRIEDRGPGVGSVRGPSGWPYS